MASKGKATTKSARRSTRSSKKAKSYEPVFRASKIYASAKKVVVQHLPPEFSRADLEFIGVDHSGASFEARVFVNKPDADENTSRVDENGYAGSFSIFGHGGCFGDAGHCEINPEQDDFDPRPSHPLRPIKKVVIATEAIKRAAAQNLDITITVVPVITSWTEQNDLEDVLKFDHINLITYS